MFLGYSVEYFVLSRVFMHVARQTHTPKAHYNITFDLQSLFFIHLVHLVFKSALR